MKNYQKVLFTRIGWMNFYNGPVPGDERPMGAGRYNMNAIGHEAYNFRVTNSRLYGYFQPSMRNNAVALERIDPAARDLDHLSGCLVVFVSPRPSGSQVIIGWYRNADVNRYRNERSPGKPRGFGHFCVAQKSDCVLLPEPKRVFEIPTGRGAFGQANVCYPLDQNGRPKDSAWIRKAISYVDSYNAENLLLDPEADAEQESAAAAESAIARSKGQGFARTAAERKALEEHSMRAAIRYFRRQGYKVKDVSSTRSYDLCCICEGEELHVEVKGTTTDGSTVVLTYNEVQHARSSKNNCALFILHSITLKGMKASGGKRRILNPWSINPRALRPVSYTYAIDEDM